MAVLPRSPRLGALPNAPATVPARATPSPLPSLSNPSSSPTRSPAFPSSFNPALSKKQSAHLSSEPPLLDLAASTVFESPALMPASAAMAVPYIESLPSLAEPPPANPFSNPFSRAAVREAACSAAAVSAGPVEGGILMLNDIQESNASQAVLVSAWRDYGCSQVGARSLPCSSACASYPKPSPRHDPVAPPTAHRLPTHARARNTRLRLLTPRRPNADARSFTDLPQRRQLPCDCPLLPSPGPPRQRRRRRRRPPRQRALGRGLRAAPHLWHRQRYASRRGHKRHQWQQRWRWWWCRRRRWKRRERRHICAAGRRRE